MSKADYTQCRTCLYCCKGNTLTCNYAYDTGKLRGCPPSPNCTAYKKATAKERKKLIASRRKQALIAESADEYTAYMEEHKPYEH